jgi:DNA-binding beta-propeller fold protein YncE
MMKTILSVTLVVLGCAASTHAETAWAVDSRSLLLSFDTNLPGFVRSLRLIQGLQPGEGIVGIDFRPANKKLYGLGSSSRVYLIDTETGAATAVGSGPFTPALDGTEFGFDFNPTVDRIRVVSNKGQNLRLHPDTGMVAATDLPLNYEGATGAAEGIVASAYTNSVAGATTTTLYGIDARRKALVTQAPPNDGRLNIVGMLVGLEPSMLAGFDISPVTGRGYVAARLTNSAKTMVYEIHLPTGDYNPMGELSIFEQISGLAIEPAR